MTDETRNSMGGQARAETVIQAGRIDALHQHVHAAAPDPSSRDVNPPSYQLPAERAHFHDRDAEQARIFQAVQALTSQPGRTVRPLIISVTGMGGVGKSALGVRTGHRLENCHTEGALYIDLDDLRRDGSVEISDVLAELLRSLHVREPWLERSFAARTRQYRELTAGRRLVVILDNVRHVDEVEQLLPVSAESVVVAISHHQLHDLYSALTVPLGPFSDEDAVVLLQRIADDSRLTTEPETAIQLARLCGGLPAALHVAGEWIRRHRRRRPARLVAELAAELDEKGLPVVEAVWDAAYQDLSPSAARLYRLLAEHPGPDFTEQAAAAVLGEGADAAADALDELETASLLESGERLRMHALLRAHAHRRARQHGDAAEAGQARRRIVRWYRRQAERADVLMSRQRMRLAKPVPELPYAPDVPLGSTADAARWLDAERLVLYGCVRLAYDAEDDTDAWSLCEPLWTHFMDHRRYADAIDAFRTGLAAAQRAEHLPAQVRMRCQLARPLWEVGRWEEARRELAPAVRAVEAGMLAGERKLCASTLEFRGKLRSAGGDWAGAVEDFTASRRIHEEIGNAYGVLLQTHLLGKATAQLGELERAAELLSRAHQMAREQRRERMTGRTAFELSKVLRRIGNRTDRGRAIELAEEALASAQRRGSDFEETRVRLVLAELAEEAGDEETAGAHRAAVRAIEERVGKPRQP
ncbi:NB-ARC domain-containing protein [Streptomyces gobiensis]|uniref:NB-ARC domain-containing protein n=1 Tax=Streptomyces gobiensis TaxID=2875706 RepID=UPI001E473689|nr:NB-ARC domain-containing protein [Streptomyces gobiensis]UGY90786.1 hypothetical protein test1122_02970 [Streptomyces gobiensis]